ncbi:alkaline phosphatase family protein [Bradyrhizobium sp. LHD-71]|uniref:alkaline phosphatase family protein n=1 Tax=Bradyrhizobium sp. LHD-71 TaxID=3072141 RepID=UPI002810719B|nr:alkaline phosphatase family protein [Bradyrhizobium sp. LHD-71]MDQ8731049.1 alkaline phosphatase family protein [Bradyrhizobium sp. LHD-71]
MPSTVKNVLFIMCDQLRWDYLSCAGHPTLHTPHIDALAARGVRFTRAYVQSPICGPSRMSFYTGRYMHSHGSTWNGIPLQVGELTMGDYLRPLGVQTVLVGKTHMVADREGMERLGVAPDSIIGVRVSECGFDPYERDDGLRGRNGMGGGQTKRARYDRFLNEQGYGGDNPWHDWANSAADEGGGIASGWAMRHARKPARVSEEHSETPYMTRRAIDFIRESGERPWCLHLSYIKPHWPYVAPAPYNDMYSADDLVPVVRSEKERQEAHPVYREFISRRVSRTFARDEVRNEVVPVYMGLIKQIDDQMGVLFRFLEENGYFENTMIVFTSDHGDYLGDHWLGEKELFHDPSVKIPLIVYDPSRAADQTRGATCDELVESIDLLPTFLEVFGGVPVEQTHRLEGRSLLPLVRGARPADWRNHVISEYDYSVQSACAALGVAPQDARMFMVADRSWKYIHAIGFRPMLFDLSADPDELHDLGADPSHEAVRQRLAAVLSAWALRLSQRQTRSDQQIVNMRGGAEKRGILIGVWDEADVGRELWSGYLSDRAE